MKWVVHAPAEAGFAAHVDGLFRAETRHADAVLLESDLAQALLLAAQVLGSEEALRAAERNGSASSPTCDELAVDGGAIVPVFGRGPQALLQHELFPGRGIIERAIDRVRCAGSSPAQAAVLVGITSFSGPHLRHGRSLCPELARATGVDGGALAFGATVFDALVPLHHGGRRSDPDRGLVEVRSVHEWDVMVMALFGSASFRDAQLRLSLAVRVDLALPPTTAAAAPPVASTLAPATTTVWLVGERHAAEFAEWLAPSAAAGAVPLALAIVTSAAEAATCAAWARQLAGLGEPEVDGGGSCAIATEGAVELGEGGSSNALSPRSADVLRSERARLEQRRRRLEEEMAAAAAAQRSFPGAATCADIQSARVKLEALGADFDDAEAALRRIAHRTNEERAAADDCAHEVEQLRRRLAASAARRQELEEERAGVAAAVAAVAKEISAARAEHDEASASAGDLLAAREAAARELQGARDAEARRYRRAHEEAEAAHAEALKRISRGAALRRDEQLHEAQRRHAALHRECEAAKRAAESEGAAAAEAQHRTVRLRKELAHDVDVAAALRAEATAVQAELAELRDARGGGGGGNPLLLGAHSAEAAASRKAARARLQEQLRRSTDESASLRGRVATADRHIAQLEQKRHTSERALRQARDVLRPRLAAQLTEIAAGVVAAEAAQRAELSALQRAELADAALEEMVEWRVVMVDAECALRRASVDDLRRQVADGAAAVEDAGLQNAAASENVTRLRRQLEQLRREHEATVAHTLTHIDEIRREGHAVAGGEGAVACEPGTASAAMLAEAALLEERMALLRSCLAQACNTGTIAHHPPDDSDPAKGTARSAAVTPAKTAAARALHAAGRPATVAGRSARFAIAPPPREIAARLGRLIDAAAQSELVAVEERRVACEAAQRADRERAELECIRAAVADSIATAERQLSQRAALLAETQAAVDDHAARHETAKAQLHEEFVLAQRVVHQHQQDTREKLHGIFQRTEELSEMLRRSDREMRTLRCERDVAATRCSAAGETTLRLDLQRAATRREALRQQLAAVNV